MFELSTLCLGEVGRGGNANATLTKSRECTRVRNYILE